LGAHGGGRRLTAGAPRGAGVWPWSPANLGHALCNFDIMASLLAHPLTDEVHFWTTRWRTGAYNPGWVPDLMDAFKARPPPAARSAAGSQPRAAGGREGGGCIAGEPA
jgi:hypothetical protein